MKTITKYTTKYAPARLAVYSFQKDDGGLPAAHEMFLQLLAARYHPSLTSTTTVNGIYALTLVELPINELEAFRTQQLADEQRWGKPLSYFDFAKLNPRLPVEITADDYAYMLGVLPPSMVRTASQWENSTPTAPQVNLSITGPVNVTVATSAY